MDDTALAGCVLWRTWHAVHTKRKSMHTLKAILPHHIKRGMYQKLARGVF
jgi:hypothetical protein